jgi:hydroxyethylthiazole kinase-like uncharacterized protein yjeF
MPARTSPKPASVTRALLRNWPLPVPPSDSDKEDRGRVLVVGGATETPGAALLAATAALRAGAGKWTIAAPASVAASLALAMPEARSVSLACSRAGALAADGAAAMIEEAADADSALFGPGMAKSRSLVAAVVAAIKGYPALRVVLDATALDAVKVIPQLRCEGEPCVVATPHAGEMARLVGVDKRAIVADPTRFATRLAQRSGIAIVLKGAVTIVAQPDGKTWQHVSASPGLATSGSGDVLAGAIAGLAARGASIVQAAVWAVALHAEAGEALARRYGRLGLLARELPAELPRLMRQLAAA